MFSRRGLSLVEMLVCISMVVVITFATTSLFAFVIKRVGAQAAESSVQMQTNMLTTELDKMISQAKNCRIAVQGSARALVCEMPMTGTDQDLDGVPDTFVPDSTAGGKEIFNTGFFVWFYMSDASGTWGASGNYLWRAIVNGPGDPTAASIDTKWSKYYGAQGRWNLIDAVDYAVDYNQHLTTFTITASSLYRADRSGTTAGADDTQSRIVTSRSVYWENFRNLIVNGSFEQPDVSGNGWGYFNDDMCPGGWVQSGGNHFEIQFGGFGARSYKGKQHLELDSDLPSSIKQSVPTIPGRSYTFRFYYTPRPGTADNKIEVKWDGNTIANLDGDGRGLPSSAAWTLKTYMVTATSTVTDVEFLDHSATDLNGGLLDNVEVIPN